MLENKDAVIFDLDGTLVDSMWIWPAVDIDYLAKYDLIMPPDFHQPMEGMSYTETAQYFRDTFPMLERSVEEIKQEWTEMAYESYTTKVPLKPGAYEFVSGLKEQGFRCAIATSNGRELVNATLKALGILDFFDSICTACEVAAGKPAPDVYLKAAGELQVDPAHCLVFEDIPNGIMAGRNAGMTVCAVEDDFSKELTLRKRQLAHYYIQSYDDIRNKQYEVL